MVKTRTNTMKATECALKRLSTEELRALHDALFNPTFKKGCVKEMGELYYAIKNEVDRRIRLHVARLEREHPEWIDTFYLDVEAMDSSEIKFDALHEYENA